MLRSEKPILLPSKNPVERKKKGTAKPKEEAKYHYTKALGTKINKPSDVKLTKIPKDIYNKIKSDGSKKPRRKFKVCLVYDYIECVP